MRILDATVGSRSIWYQKNNPFTVFVDKRCGTEYSVSENSKFSNNRVIKIYPDIRAVWQNLPIKSSSFDMVVFDPPHLFKDRGKKLSLMSKRYGVFYNDSWRQELSNGLIELFRVLKNEGTFIFKWNDTDIPVEEPLKLFPYPPLFGSRTGQKNKTHWIVFIKHSSNMNINDFNSL